MARYAGNQGYVTLGGVQYEIEEWEGEVTGEAPEGRAGGDTWTYRTSTFKDWSASFTAFMTVGSVPNPMSLVNTSAAFAGHITAASTGYFVATGRVKSARVTSPAEDHVKIVCEIEGNSGTTGPTITTGSP